MPFCTILFNLPLLLYSFEQLVADGFHATDGRMAILLFNVVKFNELHIVVLANLTH